MPDLTIRQIAYRWGVSTQRAAECLEKAVAKGRLTRRKLSIGRTDPWVFDEEEFLRWEKIYRRG